MRLRVAPPAAAGLPSAIASQRIVLAPQGVDGLSLDPPFLRRGCASAAVLRGPTPVEAVGDGCGAREHSVSGVPGEPSAQDAVFWPSESVADGVTDRTCVAGGSGGGGERSDACERLGEVGLPGPASG